VRSSSEKQFPYRITAVGVNTPWGAAQVPKKPATAGLAVSTSENRQTVNQTRIPSAEICHISQSISKDSISRIRQGFDFWGPEK
jgi:hypothetical protein